MHVILVVDDELPLVESVAYNLGKEGYKVMTALDGPSALEMAAARRPDLVLLDVMLPGLDGFEVCRAMRRESSVPIIMLTAKESEADRVTGLELGADDYVTKPFGMRELMARVKAVLRRSSPALAGSTSEETIDAGDIFIDVSKREARVRGMPIELSPKEFDLLRMLASNPGRVLTRDMLLDRVWGYDFYGDSRTVDVHVRWLREKIEVDPGAPKYVTTVRGAGYKFTGGSS